MLCSCWAKIDVPRAGPFSPAQMANYRDGVVGRDATGTRGSRDGRETLNADAELGQRREGSWTIRWKRRDSNKINYIGGRVVLQKLLELKLYKQDLWLHLSSTKITWAFRCFSGEVI